MEAIEGTREDPVAATAGLELDTTLQSPDGYELSFGDGRGGGLLLRDLRRLARLRAAAAQGRPQRVDRRRRGSRRSATAGRVRRLGDRQALSVDDAKHDALVEVVDLIRVTA